MRNLREIDELTLVDLARRDRGAFAELYRRHVHAVHAFARRRTSSADDADDITAVTFERALRHLHRYRHERGSALAWLYRIATNEIIDQARRHRRQRSPRAQAGLRVLSSPDPSATQPDSAVDRSDPELLAALDRLPDRYNTVLTLRFIAGLEPDEIAGHLGITPGNCAVITHRALAALRRDLQKGRPT